MPGWQVLRTTDLPESLCLDGRTQDGGAVGRRGGVDGRRTGKRMMRISLLKMGQCGTMMMAASKRVHLVCALCGPHRLLVLIRYVDGSATTPVLDMGSESTPHYRVL